MRSKAGRWWRRLREQMRDDRGSHTVQELMWVLFWAGTIVLAIGVIGPWVYGKAQEIVGF